MQTNLQENNSFGARLEYLIRLKGFKSANEFAMFLGYKSSEKLRRLIREPDNNPSFDIIQDIANRFADVNIRWLITGNEKPLLAENSLIESGKGNLNLLPASEQLTTAYTGYEKHGSGNEKGNLTGNLSSKTNGLEMPKVISVDSTGNENIVFVPVKAAAGYLTGFSDPVYIETLPSYRLPGFDNGTFRMFEVEGHSMGPKLLNRDKIIGKWCNLNEIRDSSVHIIVTKQNVLVKRVINRIERDGVLILRSDNPSKYEYPDIIIDIDEVTECWYGIGKLSKDLSGPADIYTRVNDLEGRLAIMEHLFKKNINR